MAKWDQITDRGDVEDRRGMRMTTGIVGGISLTGILMVLAVGYFGGQDQAISLLDQLLRQPTTEQTQTTTQYDGVDSYEKFVSEVLGSNNALWTRTFADMWEKYQSPKLVLFRGATNSSCGGALSAVGPHYCNLDGTIYLDETFFDELTNRFGARGGDVAQGYVIAHEAGHHVQDELGILDQVENLMRQHPDQKNELSVALELQADCLAWIWTGEMEQEWIISRSEMEEAIDAAASVGDDNIQKMTTGYINPEAWTHGSSVDRKKWLGIGYTNRSIKSCDTFN